VNVRGDSSGCRAVTSGVRQGSVLGPLLFLIFINGIESVLLKFANDTKILGVVEDVVQHQLLQDDLSKLDNWSKKWQMHTTKCKILHKSKNFIVTKGTHWPLKSYIIR